MTNQRLETRIAQQVPAYFRSSNRNSLRTTKSEQVSSIGQNLLDKADCAAEYDNI